MGLRFVNRFMVAVLSLSAGVLGVGLACVIPGSADDGPGAGAAYALFAVILLAFAGRTSVMGTWVSDTEFVSRAIYWTWRAPLGDVIDVRTTGSGHRTRPVAVLRDGRHIRLFGLESSGLLPELEFNRRRPFGEQTAEILAEVKRRQEVAGSDPWTRSATRERQC